VDVLTHARIVMGADRLAASVMPPAVNPAATTARPATSTGVPETRWFTLAPSGWCRNDR
jgi:hypothetical protein